MHTNKYIKSKQKRFLDICVVLLISPLTLIILILILVIKFLEDLSNPFYISKRVGLNQKEFNLFKIRSMKPGDHLLSHPTASKKSPITTFGKIIRRIKLDELPQIINVILGDMSLVGPRPNVPSQVYDGTYTQDDFLVFKIKPGLIDISSLYFTDLNKIASKNKAPHEYYLKNIFPKKITLIKDYIRLANINIDIFLILIVPICIFFPKLGKNILKKTFALNE